MDTKFIFDLDGTITSVETLPLIAQRFNVSEDIATLTAETIKGNIPFAQSFIRRIEILGHLPVDEISKLLADVPIYANLHGFILSNANNCFIATGNVKCWINRLTAKIGCCCYSSECLVLDNKIEKLTKILYKEEVVKKYKRYGHRVVFIGEGENDKEAMRIADISIASGITHTPAKGAIDVADDVVFDEASLCRILAKLI